MISRDHSYKAGFCSVRRVVRIEPEPTQQEREAIVAALGADEGIDLGSWEQTALAEGVEEAELDP